MEKFVQLTGIAAPMDAINVDTDQIIPKLHLRTIKRTGLGKVLFDCEIEDCAIMPKHVGKNSDKDIDEHLTNDDSNCHEVHDDSPAQFRF